MTWNLHHSSMFCMRRYHCSVASYVARLHLLIPDIHIFDGHVSLFEISQSKHCLYFYLALKKHYFQSKSIYLSISKSICVQLDRHCLALSRFKNDNSFLDLISATLLRWETTQPTLNIKIKLRRWKKHHNFVKICNCKN